ncbi:hypothetical protein [Alteriqipengyuania sp.]|uniref:hypothetical protein n=1 Tax=Alteriqipengyuania sp. TaxID=2800692 RepID=UPI00351156D1
MAGNNRIADLHAALTWDLDDFERGTRQIDNGFGRLIDRARQVADDFASVGKQMTKALTLPIAGMGAAFTARAVMFSNDAKEIKVAAGIASDSLESFQRRAHAANVEVGMSMEKFADISKDTLDKVGDYFATGGGELKEFFEDVAPRVGVTAEMFRGLSGPDALQLYYNTLDRANVSQQEMTFFLEAIADEGSALIPLLAEDGRLFEELGKQANVFDEEDIERWIRLHVALRDLGKAFDKFWQAIAATGIIDWLASAIEKLTGFVEGFARANPMLFKFGVIALGIAAALGPVLMVLTTLAVAILPLFLVGLGPVFLALSALINPLGTLLVVGGKFAGVFASQLLPLLGRLALGFVGLTGPIGAVVGLILLFADRIIDGLKNVWQIAQETLGPSLARLFDAVSDSVARARAAFNEFSQSPIGQFLGFIIGLLGDLVEALVTIAGSAVIGAFNILITLITAVVDATSGMVEIVANLLSGDWAGAWEAAGNTVARVVADLFPIFQNLWSWIEGTLVRLGLMEARAAQANAAVRGEENGPHVSKTLSGKTIYTNELLELGDYQSTEPWRRTPDISVPKVSRGSGRGATGPSAKELEERRALLELDHQIAVARERGDEDRLRSLERERELKRMVEQYERAGLSTVLAKAAAERDMLDLDQARAETRAREFADSQRSFDIQLARIREDYAHLQALEDEEFLQNRIAELKDRTATLAEAENQAAQDLKALEEARADAVERRLAAQQAAHQIELAELRGDRALADSMRENERVLARAKELADSERMNATDALEQAQREAADRSRAYLQGSYRDAFRGGLYAAMNGNFWDWFRDRMRESSFNALAKVLDKLADSLANMVFDSKGGGLLGALGQVLGLVAPAVSSGGGSARAGIHSHSPGTTNSLPGFASGGSFRVRGFAGIDQNILSLNGTPVARVSQSEILDVRKGEPAGGGSTQVGVDVRLLGFTDMFDMEVDQRIDRKAPGIAAQGAADGVKAAIDLNPRTHGAAFATG